MKQLVILFVLHLSIAKAQERLAKSYFNEAAAASANQPLWKTKLYGPMLFVDPKTKQVYSNQPDSAGNWKLTDSIYIGTLPKDMMVANTAIQWQGKKWTMLLWPLPTDRDARVSLMLHECFHRVQDLLKFPAHSPTADHLATYSGRLYFLLELQALKAALSSSQATKAIHIANALSLRKKRAMLFPKTFPNESILEINEGLAEYTGMMLGIPEEKIKKHLNIQIDSAKGKQSLIRSFAYLSGPIYGYLLHQKDKEWTSKIDSSSNLPALLAKAYHLQKSNKTLSIAAAAKLYHAEQLLASELAKERNRIAIATKYVMLYTKKPTLTINLIKMNIIFNPNNLFDLGELGTVYPTAEIKDDWGTLIVSNTGLLMKDWKIIKLPIEDFLRPKPKTIIGKGWQLLLNNGWDLKKIDALNYQLVQQ